MTTGVLVALAAAAAAVAVLAAVVAVVAVVRLRRGWIVTRVHGDSMLPALHDGQAVLVRRCPGTSVRAGDIVVCRWPPQFQPVGPARGRPVDKLVKRVAAVAGQPLPAVFAERHPGLRTVPPGTIMVVSDGVGTDSRHFGPLPDDRVVGVLTRRLFTA